MLGIEAEKAPSEEDVHREERHRKIVLAWKYLRDRIDRGSYEYLRSGDSRPLQDFVTRPALDSLIAHLDKLREHELFWEQPERMTRTEPRYEVISEQLDSKNQPTTFIVQETFSDRSVLSGAGMEKAAPGDTHSIQAKVEVIDGQHFRLLSVIEVKGKTI